jgi:hypothetical protein
LIWLQAYELRMKLKLTKSGTLAISLWALSFILACRIHPGSHFIWVPDTLLLFGFLPLLISSRACWLWLVFGLGNLFAGCVLDIASVIPAEKFVPYHVVEIKHHLDQYHPFIIWMLIGAVSTVIAIILLTIKFIFWLRKKIKK